MREEWIQTRERETYEKEEQISQLEKER